MLLAVQALLPLSVRADAAGGWGAVGLVVHRRSVPICCGRGSAGRKTCSGSASWSRSCHRGIGWINLLLVWLLPQQLGIAWKRGRFDGPVAGGG
jgi:hypothetical protein